MDYAIGNYVLDVILIAASIWMLVSVRGIGGIMGRTLNLIIAGAIILGVAHLLASLGTVILHLDGAMNNFIHRLIVLLGFVLVALGFRQAQQLTR
jgi:hypothetical protein